MWSGRTASCVQRAVLGADWHMRELVAPHVIETKGAFLVDGHLNKRYKVVTSQKTRSNNFDDNGRHSIAVADGKIKDSAFLPQR